MGERTDKLRQISSRDYVHFAPSGGSMNGVLRKAFYGVARRAIAETNALLSVAIMAVAIADIFQIALFLSGA